MGDRMYTITQDATGTWIASKQGLLLVGTGLTANGALESLRRLEASTARFQKICDIIDRVFTQLDQQTRAAFAKELADTL